MKELLAGFDWFCQQAQIEVRVPQPSNAQLGNLLVDVESVSFSVGDQSESVLTIFSVVASTKETWACFSFPLRNAPSLLLALLLCSACARLSGSDVQDDAGILKMQQSVSTDEILKLVGQTRQIQFPDAAKEVCRRIRIELPAER